MQADSSWPCVTNQAQETGKTAKPGTDPEVSPVVGMSGYTMPTFAQQTTGGAYRRPAATPCLLLDSHGLPAKDAAGVAIDYTMKVRFGAVKKGDARLQMPHATPAYLPCAPAYHWGHEQGCASRSALPRGVKPVAVYVYSPAFGGCTQSTLQ
jgi:hypothetical protein